MFQGIREGWDEVFAEVDRKFEGLDYPRGFTNTLKVAAAVVYVLGIPFVIGATYAQRGIARLRQK